MSQMLIHCWTALGSEVKVAQACLHGTTLLDVISIDQSIIV